MADKKISQLNPVTLPLAGTEELAIVQSGETKKIAASDIGGGGEDNDIKLLGKTFNISHTGTTGNTTVYSLNIPANTFQEGSRLKVSGEIEKINNNAVWALRFRFNNNLSTTDLYAKVLISASLDYYGFERTISFTDTQAVTMRSNNSANNTDRLATDVWSKINFDFTQSADFELRLQLADATDELIVRNLALTYIE